MRIISAIDEQILKHLAHYKFLTLSQLVRLQTGEKSYVSSRLKLLRDDGFVGVSEYGGVFKRGHGRAENINYLLSRGVKLLEDNFTELEGTIHYPKNIDATFRNDYFHRISTVNTQVAFELWANKKGYNPLFFHTYFHKVGSTKKAKENNPLKSITRVTFPDSSFVEPDCITGYDTNNKRLLLVIEISNGKDTTRIVEQLKRLAGALSLGLITKLYQQSHGIQVSPRILSTVETTDMLRLVLKRIREDAFFSKSWMEQAFFFQVADKIKEDFGAEWFTIKEQKIDLSIFAK
jgi:hypothetical protein